MNNLFFFKPSDLNPNMHFQLNSSDPLTEQIHLLGVHTWHEAVKYIQLLPYGRNKNRHDLSLVLSEKKGTCSSKHALLKQVADLNEIPCIKLILGLYKMNHLNTPNIGDELIRNNLEYIPEAHCYLCVNGKRLDVTTEMSSFKTIEQDILVELEIEPNQVATFKIKYHQNYVADWLKSNNHSYTFDALWDIREQCIKRLSESSI